MNSFFKNNYEKFLVALGALFLVAVVLTYLWSVSYLSNIFGSVFNPEGGGDQAIRFNLEGARGLNLVVSE